MSSRKKPIKQKVREVTYGMKKLDNKMMNVKKSYSEVSSLINVFKK